MVDVAVGALNQALLDANPTNAVFDLATGIHRVTSELAPKAGQTFVGQGRGNTFVNGAIVLTGWVSDGSGHWYVQNADVGGADFTFPQQVGGPSGTGRYNWLRDVIFDGAPLKHVTSLGACITGCFFCDDTASPKRVYVGDDPTGQTVELSTATFIFKASVADVSIRRMTIENCANAAQTGMIAENGTGWVVEDCDIRHAHGVGWKAGDKSAARGWQIKRCKIYDNGQLGYGGQGENILMERCEVYDNGYAGYDASGATAEKGNKFARTKGLIIRRCLFRNTPGKTDWVGVRFDEQVKAVWLDIDNTNFLIEDNIIYYAGWGIDVEISPGPGIIRRNTLKFCAQGPTSSLFEAAILLSTSGASDNVLLPGGLIEVYQNYLVCNNTDSHSSGGHLISVTEENRFQSGVRYLSGDYDIWGNTLVHPGQNGRSGVRDDYGASNNAIARAIFHDNIVHGDTGGDQRHWEFGSGGGTGTWYTLANAQAAYPAQEVGTTYDNVMPAGYATLPSWSMYQDIDITASGVIAAQIAAVKTKTAVAGATVTAGQFVYYDNTTDTFRLADADAAASATAVGIALHNASSGQPLIVATEGTITMTGSTITKGAVYVISGNPGSITDFSTLQTGQYAFRAGIGLVDNRLMLALADMGAVEIA